MKKRRRKHNILLWALALSIVAHFTILPLLISLWGRHTQNEFSREVTYVSTSSAIRIEHRVHPRAARPMRRPIPRVPAPVRITHAPPRRQVAKIQPRETIVVPRLAHQSPIGPRDTLAQTLAQQQVSFEKTIAQSRAQIDPIAGAARPVGTPEAHKPYSQDFSASIGSGLSAEGILYRVNAWHDGEYDYYYVRYWVQYADGTTETGIVPWPIRYLPSVDPFALHYQHFPLPGPLSDYNLPPGTNLHPLVAYCYEHRLDLCPIQHD